MGAVLNARQNHKNEMVAKDKCFKAFGYPDKQFEAVISESLHCGICSCVFKDPVMCKNEHCFCRGCITKHLENYHTCPCCNQDLTVGTLTRIFKNLLSEQRIRCDHHKCDCQEIVQLGNLASHVAVCGKAPVLCENEECSSEINREDQFQHHNEECRFREVKCRNCKEMSSMVQGIGTRLDSLSEHVQKLDTSVTSANVQSTEVKTRLTTLEDKFAEMENKFGDRLEGMKNGFKEMENQLLQMKDLRLRDGQHGAERGERENSRRDQACAAEPSSGMEDNRGDICLRMRQKDNAWSTRIARFKPNSKLNQLI